MKWSFGEKAIALILAIILVLVSLVSFVSHKNTTELINSYNKVQKTYELLHSLSNFFAQMTVAESGRRGYIFSGDKKELERYKTARVEMRLHLSKVDDQLTESSQLQKFSHELNDLVNQRLTLLSQSINIYYQNSGAFQAQSSITQRSVQIREKIIDILAKIKNEEQRQLNIYLEQSRLRINQRVFIEQLAIFLSFLMILIASFIFYQERFRRQQVLILRQALAQEREITELKHNLFSMISHEFRTPLTVILASSELLAESLQPSPSPKQLKNLSRLQISAKLMNHMLTDILTLTRAEVGKLEFKPDWIDLEEFCLNLLEDIESFSVVKPNFKFLIQGCSKKVFLDEKILYSILSNLLLNAIKYSPKNTQIDLFINREKNDVILLIKDKGIGILPEELEKVFQPFSRGENVDNIPGTGLGLAVVKKCLEIHGGKISLESELGKGTTFLVAIPCSKK